MNESIETSFQAKKKWILIRNNWYKFESENKALKNVLSIESLKL